MQTTTGCGWSMSTSTGSQCDDGVQDWDAFMAERCQATERERLQQCANRRKEARHARGLLRKPAGQGPPHGWAAVNPNSV